MDNKKFFYLSGIFSISLYITIFISMLFYFVQKEEILKKYKILQKSIEVTILEPKPKKIEKKKVKKIEKSVKKSVTKTKKRAGSRSAKEEVDISKLFSAVKVKTKKIKKEPIKKEKNIPSRYKGKGEKRESAKEILKKMNIKDVSKALAKTKIENVEGEVDEYMSKVYEILYRYWLPSQESAGNRAKVKIIIDNNGNFDYKVLLFSSSEIFNKELVEYLNYLKTKKFPIPKEGYKEIKVYFEAK